MGYIHYLSAEFAYRTQSNLHMGNDSIYIVMPHVMILDGWTNGLQTILEPLPLLFPDHRTAKVWYSKPMDMRKQPVNTSTFIWILQNGWCTSRGLFNMSAMGIF